LLGLAVLAAGPASAHHSASPHYDLNSRVEIAGIIERFEARNPHSFIYVRSADRTLHKCEFNSIANLVRVAGVRPPPFGGQACVNEGISDDTQRWSTLTHRVRTNIDIDDELMTQALQSSGARTKRAAVEEGLRLLIQTRRQGSIRRLRGRVAWEGDLAKSRRSRAT
jgi:Arc/MetJ family transcription regulator